jgi:alkanesulfonate monooxygenase SsuD/methylene tetrahydromethanopterin reductase-like flavin-dependent oxidoreductase (luciferase family)
MSSWRPLRFGIITLQQVFDSVAGVVARARRCEALGFDSFWLADHPSMPPRREMVRLEGWTLLAVLAARTSRIRLGLLVGSITPRHPTLLALQAATVDQISGGRLELGLGAAGAAAAYAVLGLDPWPPGERVARLREQAEILDGLLRSKLTAYDGRYYRARDAWSLPVVQRPRPPLVIAAQAPRALRVVVRFADTWSSLGGQPLSALGGGSGDRRPLEQAVAETGRKNRLLDRCCTEAGRDPPRVARSVAAYRVDPPPFASVGAFEEFVGRYREVGMHEFVFYWPCHVTSSYAVSAGPVQEAVLERVVATVIPALRRGR